MDSIPTDNKAEYFSQYDSACWKERTQPVIRNFSTQNKYWLLFHLILISIW